MAAEELRPLPAGRHGYSREQVSHHQRERLIAAFAEVAAERGYDVVTIGDVTKAASVSRRAFYELFDNKEACFLAVYDAVVEHFRGLVAEAMLEEPDWPREVIAALRTMLDFLASEPALARVCMVESLSAGPGAAARFQGTVDSFVPLLEPGRALREGDRPLPDSTETSLIGALATRVSREVAVGNTDRLPRLLPDLAEFALTPYLGQEQAHAFATGT